MKLSQLLAVIIALISGIVLIEIVLQNVFGGEEDALRASSLLI